ncbi:MAG TPA: hypothetical protein VNB06_09435 [Thermoanaerobaculia bacterium]|nr:hypothetical protein [Thermoanaerobaculia bacterium]
MREFFDQAFTMPTAVFSVLLVLVVLYWSVKLLSGFDLFGIWLDGAEGAAEGGLDAVLDADTVDAGSRGVLAMVAARRSLPRRGAGADYWRGIEPAQAARAARRVDPRATRALGRDPARLCAAGGTGGSEEDPAVRVVRQIGMVGDGSRISGAPSTALPRHDRSSAAEVAEALEGLVRPIVTQLGEALTALAARPVVAAEPPAKKRSAKPAGDGDDAALGTVALRAQAQQLTNRLDELLARLGDVLSVVAQREAPPAPTAMAAGRADAPAQPSGAVSLELYLARLDQTLAAMARRPSGVAVTQRLGPVVLKRLDEMKELVAALRRLDTGRIAPDGG